MWKGLSVLLSMGLLASLVVAGCGGSGETGDLQSEENGSTPEKATSIPPPGTVLIPRPVDWATSLGEPSRAMDTSLTLGKLSDAAGAPTTGTVARSGINLYSAQVNSVRNPIVWTMTPIVGTKGKTGDNDLAIAYGLFNVFASSAHYGPWEEWVAFEPAVGRYFGLIYGVPDEIVTHKFRVEADVCSPLTVNGSAKTGKENKNGSDWFYFDPPFNYNTWACDPITVTLTALGGDDPDLYLYDSYHGNGSAPVAASYDVGDDTVSYTSPYGSRLLVRVRAYAVAAAPCDYVIAVTSP